MAIMQQLPGQQQSYNVYIHDYRFLLSNKTFIMSEFANHSLLSKMPSFENRYLGLQLTI